jgi:RNA polymerase sigma factor (sigma-70 family)
VDVDVKESHQVLWRQYRAEPGNAALRDKLFRIYLPWVNTLWNVMKRRWPPQLDTAAIYEAMIFRLIPLIDREYDPSRNTSFKTFAASKLRWAAVNELRRENRTPAGKKIYHLDDCIPGTDVPFASILSSTPISHGMEVRELAKGLDYRQRVAVVLHFVHEFSWRDVGEILGICEESARQIGQKALLELGKRVPLCE